MLSRILGAGRVARVTIPPMGGRWTQAQAFHAGTPLQNEEKAAAPEEQKSSGIVGFLSDPTRAAPIGMILAIPALQQDVYMLSEETQLFGCFLLFTGTMYSYFGDAIGAAFDEKGESILKEHHAIEDANIQAVALVKEAHVLNTTILEDIQFIAEAQKAVMADAVAAKTLKLKHDVRAEFIKKLDTVVQAEAGLASSVQKTVVSAATASVTDQFLAGGDKSRSDALTAAMDSLAGKPAATDAIGGLYSNFLADFSKNLAAAKNQEQTLSAEIIAQIKDDMEALKRRDNLTVEVAPPSKIVIGEI